MLLKNVSKELLSKSIGDIKEDINIGVNKGLNRCVNGDIIEIVKRCL